MEIISFFLKKEEEESANFQSKPRKILTEGNTAVFNGSTIGVKKNGIYYLNQSDKLRGMNIPTTKEDFISVRAQAQYIRCCTRPDLCASVQLLAAMTDDQSENDIKTMAKIVKQCHDTAEIGLNFVPLDVETLRLVVLRMLLLQMQKGLSLKLDF